MDKALLKNFLTELTLLTRKYGLELAVVDGGCGEYADPSYIEVSTAHRPEIKAYGVTHNGALLFDTWQRNSMFSWDLEHSLVGWPSQSESEGR